MPDWTIRSAIENDIAPVLRLWEAVNGPPGVSDTPEGLSLLLSTSRGALLVAESHREVIGSLIAAWDGWRGSFYRLAVHPDRRRQGIATGLLAEGERHLQARGALRLTAIVGHEDPAAMGFWESAGYRWQQQRARFVRVQSSL